MKESVENFIKYIDFRAFKGKFRDNTHYADKRVRPSQYGGEWLTPTPKSKALPVWPPHRRGLWDLLTLSSALV